MRHADRIHKPRRNVLWPARAATFALGIALAARGLAPVVLFRWTTGEPPPTHGLGVGSVTAGLGAAFIALAFALCERRRWTLWGAAGGAVTILGGTIAAQFLGPSGTLAAFPLLLSLAVVATIGLALSGTRSGFERPDADEDPPIARREHPDARAST